MANVNVNGVAFHVQRLGKGSPLVMVHGAFGNVTSWYFTVAPRVARHHECIMYDLRGHGRSARVTNGFDLRTMTDDLHSLLDELCLDQVALVGHSFGALVALRMALRHPQRVSRLIIVEALLPLIRDGEVQAFMSKKPNEMLELLPPVAQQFVKGGGKKAHELMKSILFLARETSFIKDMEAEPDFTDDELATIRCPTLCIYGADSPYLATGRRLSRSISGARMEILAGGHHPHADSPKECAAKITTFLARPCQAR